MNCLNYTSAMSQPFGSLIAANLAQAWCLGWKWSLWPVPTWFVVQWSKAVFILILYDSISCMKHFRISASNLSRVTAILLVDCCQYGPSWMFGLKMELMACADLVGSTTEQSCIFTDIIWYYQGYETLPKNLHHNSAVPQPFLLFIAANLTYAGCLGWRWSLCPVPYWLAVQRSKAVFFLILYDSINDMKQFWNVCIKPQPCHIHYCCWLLPIFPKLDFWAENGNYGPCRLGWRYNVEKLHFTWSYMKVSIIWNNSALSALQLSRAKATFVVDCYQFGRNWMFGLKIELMAWLTTWLVVQHSKAVLLLTLYDNINDMKQFRNFFITPQPCYSHFCCWWLPIWP